MRAFLTEDGFLFLQVAEDEWIDGDLVYEDPASCECGVTMIDDVDARPDLAQRVAAIRSFL